MKNLNKNIIGILGILIALSLTSCSESGNVKPAGYDILRGYNRSSNIAQALNVPKDRNIYKIGDTVWVNTINMTITTNTWNKNITDDDIYKIFVIDSLKK